MIYGSCILVGISRGSEIKSPCVSDVITGEYHVERIKKVWGEEWVIANSPSYCGKLLVINPGGYAHTSVAIRDALADCHLPRIEVHLSNLSGRENFRQVMLTASVCDGYVSGFKENSYTAAVYLLHKIINKKKRKN